MGAPRSQGVIALRPVAGGVLFSSGQIEALKWLALCAMFAGHINRYVLDLSSEGLYAFGRLAFPLFALALGAALTRHDDLSSTAERAAFRLLPFALVAQVGLAVIGAGAALNVLFLYMAAAAWVTVDGWLSCRSCFWQAVLVRGSALVVALLAEFSLPGLLFVLALWRWQQFGGDVRLGVVAAALVCSCFFEGSWWAFAAVPFAVLLWGVRVDIPRARNFFAWAYCGQFGVLAWARLYWG